jgi:hypothetical protein
VGVEGTIRQKSHEIRPGAGPAITACNGRLLFDEGHNSSSGAMLLSFHWSNVRSPRKGRRGRETILGGLNERGRLVCSRGSARFRSVAAR